MIVVFDLATRRQLLIPPTPRLTCFAPIDSSGSSDAKKCETSPSEEEEPKETAERPETPQPPRPPVVVDHQRLLVIRKQQQQNNKNLYFQVFLVSADDFGCVPTCMVPSQLCVVASLQLRANFQLSTSDAASASRTRPTHTHAEAHLLEVSHCLLCVSVMATLITVALRAASMTSRYV